MAYGNRYAGGEATFGEKMFGSVELTAERAALVRKSYLLLSFSVVAACYGAYIGSHSPAILKLFSGWLCTEPI